MKVLVAPNSFKESLSSLEVAAHIGKGLRKASRKYRVVQVPLADGGTGTTQIITNVFDGEFITKKVTGPLGGTVNAQYGIIKHQRVAIMELAEVAGLKLVPPAKRNPRHTSTIGAGQLLMDIIDRGYYKVMFGIGDSATIDCGVGALSQTGIQFLDKKGKSIGPGYHGLLTLASINTSTMDGRLKRAKITIASDVKNVLTGKYGALVYARQKGARQKDFPVIHKALKKFKGIIKKQFGPDLDKITGSGAAGGIGGAFVALLNAQIVSGSGMVQGIVRLEEEIASCDVVITGEGRIDQESLYGKTLKRVIDMAYIHKKPVVLIAGSIARNIPLKKKYQVLEQHSLIKVAGSKKKAFSQSGELLEKIAYAIGKKIAAMAT